MDADWKKLGEFLTFVFAPAANNMIQDNDA